MNGAEVRKLPEHRTTIYLLQSNGWYCEYFLLESLL